MGAGGPVCGMSIVYNFLISAFLQSVNSHSLESTCGMGEQTAIYCKLPKSKML